MRAVESLHHFFWLQWYFYVPTVEHAAPETQGGAEGTSPPPTMAVKTLGRGCLALPRDPWLDPTCVSAALI